jgi:hypothetical protein
VADRNLALDVLDPSGASGIVARVSVEFACSYSKDSGSPTITADCGSLRQFELEIARLKSECDDLVREARVRFGELGAPEVEAIAGEADAVAEPASGPPPEKKSTRLDTGLCVADRMTRDVRTLRRND